MVSGPFLRITVVTNTMLKEGLDDHSLGSLPMIILSSRKGWLTLLLDPLEVNNILKEVPPTLIEYTTQLEY